MAGRAQYFAVLLVLSACAFAHTACTPLTSSRAKRMIGAHEDTKRAMKHAVQIKNRVGGCSGSIIGKKFILTAAHCVIDEDTNRFVKSPAWVKIGVPNNATNVAIQHYVQKIFVPNKYMPRDAPYSFADLAVLKIFGEIDFKLTDQVVQLDLPNPRKTYENARGLIAGYGIDIMRKYYNYFTGEYEFSKSSSGKLNWELAKVLASEECQMRYPGFDKKTQMCSMLLDHEGEHKTHKGTCSGDSGGAFVYNNTVIGVLSSGETNCNERINDYVPSVFTRVSAYLDFIKKAMQDPPSTAKDLRVMDLSHYLYLEKDLQKELKNLEDQKSEEAEAEEEVEEKEREDSRENSVFSFDDFLRGSEWRSRRRPTWGSRWGSRWASKWGF